LPVDLRALVAPETTAILTMEVQRGVMGDLSTIPELAAEARSVGLAGSIGELLESGRSAGATVVHCTAGFLADGTGTPLNAPLIKAMLRRPDHLLDGTDSVDLVNEIGPEPGDLVSHRRHGVSPFGGTNLDQILRERGIRTVVATGVSLNLGIPGLAIEAVNNGYWVVVARDAVCGVPSAYAKTVLENMISLVATVTTVDDLVGCWSS
jgi:nicotinamidase-related amidase